MVMDIVHKIKYVIEFKQPVDYFNVILQKQIDLRLKFDGNINIINVLDLDNGNERLYGTTYYSKYKSYFHNFKIKSFLTLNDSPDKYKIINKIYKEMLYDKYFNELIKVKSYEEFEYEFDLMLEEFKVFCDNFEFNSDEVKIINSIMEDENLKSNIKFYGWKDYWITV